ncbi:hypothetical protein SAMN05661099_1150 [Daejeonella lutea]|uniref:Uncharacterized protein n=1 Tax=Daejeonella lutea TaxID=572036 RepID=A0A1T5AYY0_9SPHI|nr:hypothetical protein SAMN05661099_1150 [Daejeonella lutea]
MKTQKAKFALLKKSGCFTFGKSKSHTAPFSDSTIVITTTVTFALPRNS